MNWKTLAYRKKNLLLATVSIVILAIAGFSTFGTTISLYKENKKMSQQLVFAKSAPANIIKINKELKNLQKTISYLDETSDLRKELLDKVGRTSEENHVLFREFKPPVSFIDEELHVETHEIVLQGSYTALVKVLDNVERKIKMGKVTSVRFSLEKERRSKKTNLLCYMSIQSIKERKNESK